MSKSKFSNIIKILLIALLVLGLTSCGSSQNNAEAVDTQHTSTQDSEINEQVDEQTEEIDENTDIEETEPTKSSRFSEDYIGKANPFEDVSEDKYYYTPVMWAVVNNITTGTSDNTFSPNDKCSCGNILMLIWNTMGQPEVTSGLSDKFAELSDAYYYQAVLWAYYRGILDNIDTSDGWTNRTCTKADAIYMVYKASNGVSFDTGTAFNDVSVDDYYCEAITWGFNHQIVSGSSDTEFGVNDDCTRAHVVTFLYNIYNYGLIE